MEAIANLQDYPKLMTFNEDTDRNKQILRFISIVDELGNLTQYLAKKVMTRMVPQKYPCEGISESEKC